MKRYLLVIAVFTFSVLSLLSQDRVITIKGDTIYCKIKSIESKRLSIRTESNGKVINRVLPKSYVANFEIGYNRVNEKNEDIKSLPNNRISKFSYSLNFGYSKLTRKVEDLTDDKTFNYNDDLRKGYVFGADVAYNFPRTISIGFRARISKYSAEVNNITVPLSEKIYLLAGQKSYVTTKYFGPTFTGRFVDKSKTNIFNITGSVGYLHYKDEFIVVNINKATGSTVGASLGLGYSYKLYNKNTLDLKLSYFVATVKSLDIKVAEQESTKIDLDNKSEIDLNRFEITVGITFGI